MSQATELAQLREKVLRLAREIEALSEAGTISPEDPNLFSVVDSAEEGWDIVRQFYNLPDMGPPALRGD